MNNKNIEAGNKTLDMNNKVADSEEQKRAKEMRILEWEGGRQRKKRKRWREREGGKGYGRIQNSNGGKLFLSSRITYMAGEKQTDFSRRQTPIAVLTDRIINVAWFQFKYSYS
jgi:hypothetical protein